ncbi:MAG: type II toxin-antitoxin system RelE/ParE family toxin [Chloroflexi bacterium]|nr:type II toxin-antitoxin system RelE/ParE family toxin [Chloroflexota bacterium]MCI0812794.1 type II toxin-antitoxin system RelE/ParE family toxin [Chloroflexota bacterium]MCI0869287.1 type II toxin-antitoxin system RelE/ParE family toxin [Chloroflexota bacterium]
MIAAIRQLAAAPRPSGTRKLVGSDADWRIRIGAMRVIYEIDDEAQLVRVMRIRHRRDAYR